MSAGQNCARAVRADPTAIPTGGLIAGQAATVQFAGAQGQYPGLDQVNVAISKSLAGMGEVSVYLIADGKASNMTTVNVQ